MIEGGGERELVQYNERVHGPQMVENPGIRKRRHCLSQYKEKKLIKLCKTIKSENRR